jgi:hypothetical protein
MQRKAPEQRAAEQAGGADVVGDAGEVGIQVGGRCVAAHDPARLPARGPCQSVARAVTHRRRG